MKAQTENLEVDMELWLTKGLFGEKTEKLAETECAKTVLERIFAWKHDDGNRKAYKMENYDRMLFDPKRNETAVDFGDYSTFMLIAGDGSQDIMKELERK